jgi:hypothetical protein
MHKHWGSFLTHCMYIFCTRPLGFAVFGRLRPLTYAINPLYTNLDSIIELTSTVKAAVISVRTMSSILRWVQNILFYCTQLVSTIDVWQHVSESYVCPVIYFGGPKPQALSFGHAIRAMPRGWLDDGCA